MHLKHDIKFGRVRTSSGILFSCWNTMLQCAHRSSLQRMCLVFSLVTKGQTLTSLFGSKLWTVLKVKFPLFTMAGHTTFRL